MIDLRFTKKEEKQIASRFKTMYELLSKKDVWIKGAEAHDVNGNVVDAQDSEAKSFCLIGAVAHVNGPTEEEIKALLSLTILKQTDELEEYLGYVHSEADGDDLDNNVILTNMEAFFTLYSDLVNGNVVYGNVEDIIPDFNDADERKLKDIQAILKKAQALYPKMAAMYANYSKAYTAVQVAKKKAQKQLDSFSPKSIFV